MLEQQGLFLVLQLRKQKVEMVWDEPGETGPECGHVKSCEDHGRGYVEVIVLCELSFLFQFKKQKLLLELDQYAPDVAELIRTPMEMRYIPLKVALL